MDFIGPAAMRDEIDIPDLSQQARGFRSEDMLAVTTGRHPLPSVLRPELDVVSHTGEIITIPIPPHAYEIPIAELDQNIGTYSLEELKERYLETLRYLHSLRVGIMDYSRNMYNSIREMQDRSAEMEQRVLDLQDQRAEMEQRVLDLKLDIVESVVGSSQIPYRSIDLMRVWSRSDQDDD